MAAYRRGTTGMRRRDATGVQERGRTTGVRARGAGTRARGRGAPSSHGPGVVIGIVAVIAIFVGFIAFIASQSSRGENKKPTPKKKPPVAAPVNGTPAGTQPEEKPVPKPRTGMAIAKAEIKFGQKPPSVWGVCGACTKRVDAGVRVCSKCGADLEWDGEVECGACAGSGICQACKDHPRGLFGMTHADCASCKNGRKCPICRGKKRFRPQSGRPRVRKTEPREAPSGRSEPDGVPIAPYLREQPEEPRTEDAPASESPRPVLERPPDEPATNGE